MRKVFQFVFFLSLCVPSAFADPGTRSEYRAKIREWVMSHARPLEPTIAPLDNDQAADLVDELRYTSLSEMEKAGLLAARLETTPWSGSYWPTYAGSIANRYGDSSYAAGFNYRDNAKYLESVIGRGTGPELSPAEKYDLLVGDSGFTLTKKMIRSGSQYADRDGSVPTWFGICHGWAPASFMEARPRHSVKVKAANGRALEFFPADIKALATLLWANGAGETRFVGGRCNDEHPGRDDHNRETNPDCFDTNPATWHLSIVNQIGVSKRGFVADISPAAEVWNQPAVGYQYSYVNPITGASSKKLEAAKVRLADWATDPYRATRSREAVEVVKVVMSFEYGAETQPSTVTEDGPQMDAHARQTYTYDLELDGSGKIVGGEWYSSNHPDFLWTPAKGSHATSVGDDALDRQGDRAAWKIGEPVPASWRSAAKASAESEEPLARIVEKLLDAAASP